MKNETPASLPEYERTDAHPPLVAGIAAVLFGLIALGAGVGALILRHAPNTGGLPMEKSELTDAADVSRDWQVQDSLVREHLERYAWIDRHQGIVQIPIERAMELEAEKEAKP
jgi:hypothetical protein